MRTTYPRWRERGRGGIYFSSDSTAHDLRLLRTHTLHISWTNHSCITTIHILNKCSHMTDTTRSHDKNWDFGGVGSHGVFLRLRTTSATATSNSISRQRRRPSYFLQQWLLFAIALPLMQTNLSGRLNPSHRFALQKGTHLVAHMLHRSAAAAPILLPS
jgi:hypothetical protein